MSRVGLRRVALERGGGFLAGQLSTGIVALEVARFDPNIDPGGVPGEDAAVPELEVQNLAEMDSTLV